MHSTAAGFAGKRKRILRLRYAPLRMTGPWLVVGEGLDPPSDGGAMSVGGSRPSPTNLTEGDRRRGLTFLFRYGKIYTNTY